MKFCALLLLTASAFAQAPAPAPEKLVPRGPEATVEVAPDEVIATVDGKKITARDAKKLTEGLAPGVQQQFKANPIKGLGYLIMLKSLTEEAVQAKVDQQSPLKEQMEFQRQNTLANAFISDYKNHIQISKDEQMKYYETNQDKFEEVTARVIYIQFAAPNSQPLAAAPKVPPKKPLLEAEAKTKIEDLRKQLVEGADFAKIANEFSEDASSKGKDGVWGTFKRSDNLPAEVKNVVFALKPGEISQLVRQPSGYYLFRVDEKKVQPFDKVVPQVVEAARQDRFNEWFTAVQKRFEVKVENPNYFVPKAPPVPPGIPKP